jgi:hypothetical protein
VSDVIAAACRVVVGVSGKGLVSDAIPLLNTHPRRQRPEDSRDR